MTARLARGTAKRAASPLVILAVFTSGCASPAPGPVDDGVEIVILSVSDGQLDPRGGLGGAAVLSAYFAKERSAHARTDTPRKPGHGRASPEPPMEGD